MMQNKWNRRDFIKITNLATLGALSAGTASGFLSSCGGENVIVKANDLHKIFKNPPEAAKPWILWYWHEAAVSREGIKADLQAMKENGIGGAYLMPLRNKKDPPHIDPPVETLTPEWWDTIRFTFEEAEKVGLKIGIHACDGFSCAGGPWITPELSMQKVVFSETYLEDAQSFSGKLKQPETVQNYYKDIAVFAFPSLEGAGSSTRTIIPKVAGSDPLQDVSFLADPEAGNTFKSNGPAWVTYAFEKPFTCRTIRIETSGNNYHAHRLKVEVSDDGQAFRPVLRLQPHRHGWQDSEADVTHAIPATTAKYFRFVYDPEGSEPGAEDLDSAKWKPGLKVKKIELFTAPRIDKYEGKSGLVWRLSKRTTKEQVPDDICLPLNDIIDVSEYLDEEGQLNWEVPKGNWTILRVGHTSTGKTNYIGGNGLGLECDKFNAEAVELQFDNWFGEHLKVAGPDLALKVLNTFHLDSWECGSQNWSVTFREEFKKRRGYDPYPYLPVMAGFPVQNADISERFLNDVRQTISDLITDVFFGTVAKKCEEKGLKVTAESVAPTMTSDGIQHFQNVDMPMGEFWLRSPTHDKPNDILDAISGAHVYGKQLVGAEAYTEIRIDWDEHPGMLKTIGDLNYALGINKFVYHVFMHNPWMDRKPGMTLGAVGLYFQRDQTWWKPGHAWVKYAQRCQALLQQGSHVADIAVFTGEETPRRALLPDRLVNTFPGIFGKERVKREEERLANVGNPIRVRPAGVSSTANRADPEDWVDPLNGYAYDSINKDALLRLAKVQDGRIVLPGGASYAVLVLPMAHQMSPDMDLMSPEIASKLYELVKAGATVILNERPERSPFLTKYPESDEQLKKVTESIWGSHFEEVRDENAITFHVAKIGKGKLIKGTYQPDSLKPLGIERDVIAYEENKRRAKDIAWTHRKAPEFDIYFISNQLEEERLVELSLRNDGTPELYDPVTGEIRESISFRLDQGRTILPLKLAPNESVFVVFGKKGSKQGHGKNWTETKLLQDLKGSWEVHFDPNSGGPENPVVFEQLTDWSKNNDNRVKYYSGTATYQKTFYINEGPVKGRRIWLNLNKVANIAEVYVNGKNCGVVWTAPFQVEISDALNEGENTLKIEVTNTYANRLIGDHAIAEVDSPLTWTTAPYRLKDRPLLEAGLLGPVHILGEELSD